MLLAAQVIYSLLVLNNIWVSERQNWQQNSNKILLFGPITTNVESKTASQDFSGKVTNGDKVQILQSLELWEKILSPVVARFLSKLSLEKKLNSDQIYKGMTSLRPKWTAAISKQLKCQIQQKQRTQILLQFKGTLSSKPLYLNEF